VYGHLGSKQDLQNITECQSTFGLKLPSVRISDRSEIFRTKCEFCNNLLYKFCLSPMWDLMFKKIVASCFNCLTFDACLFLCNCIADEVIQSLLQLCVTA